MVMTPPPQPRPPQADAHPVGVPATSRSRNISYPRWPFLATLLLIPCVIAGYFIDSYYQQHACPFGVLCQVDRLPGALQVLLIWLAFGFCWLGAFAFGLRHLESSQAPDRTTAPIRYALWSASNVQPVRPLLLAYGVLALVEIGMALFLGRFTPVDFALGTIMLAVPLCAFFWWPRPAQANQSAQAQQDVSQVDRPWYRLRRAWLFSHLFSPRAPQPTASAGPTARVGQAEQGTPDPSAYMSEQ